MDKALTPPDTTLALMRSTLGDGVKPLGTTKAAKGSIDLQKAEEAAQEFEAVFLAEMLKPMFEGIKHDGMFGGGKGEEIFHGMMVQEYGKMFAQTGGIGIADEVKATMIRMQQEADGLDPIEIAEVERNENNPTELTNGDRDATGSE